MGVEDFHLDDFDDDALESSRYEREGRLHGASTPPGQSDVLRAIKKAKSEVACKINNKLREKLG